MAGLAALLIWLYPRGWRQRYGGEMQHLLAAEKLSWRTVADLVAGAIDARFDPQATTVNHVATSQGAHNMTHVFRCNPVGVSKQDQWRSIAWMLGGSLVLTVAGVLLRLRVGENSFSEGLLYSAFPASLMLASECTYFKRYSRHARTVMSLGGAVLVVLMMWAAVIVGNRI